jgi:hypothetical protein
MCHFLSIIAKLWRSGYIFAVYSGCQGFSNKGRLPILQHVFAVSLSLFRQVIEIEAWSLQIMNYSGRIECCSVVVIFVLGSNLCRGTYADSASRNFPLSIQISRGDCFEMCHNFLLQPCQLLFYIIKILHI